MNPILDHPRSRCTIPQDPPLTWVDFTDPEHPSSKQFAEWLDSLPYVLKQSIEAAITAWVNRAARGEIREDDDRVLEPVTTQPRVYELKLKQNLAGRQTQIRLYFAEPDELPQHLVRLHIHLKDVTGSAKEQRNRQNAEMRHAGRRLIDGTPTLWGTSS